MPNSYVTFTGNGSNRTFSFAGIDDYLSTAYIKVYINNQLVDAANYTIDVSGGNENVVFTVVYGAPASGATVKIARETPNTSSGFTSNIVDFTDGSVLTAADLDKGFKGMLHIVQEANDTGSGALGKSVDGLSWDAGSKRITNLANATSAQDAVTKSQLDAAQVYGNAPIVPQAWTFSGNGSSSDFTFSPEALNTDPNMFIVEVGGVIQIPTTDYTISASKISFVASGSPNPPANGVGIRVRNFGVSRSVLSVLPNESVTNQYLAANAVATTNIQTNAVTADKLADSAVDSASIQAGAVTAGKIASNAISTAMIQDLQVTTAKLANNAVTTDKLGLLAVTNATLGNNAVSGDKIATNAISYSNMNKATAGTLFTDSAAFARFLKIGLDGALSIDALTNIPVGTPTQDVNFQSTTGSNGYGITGLKNPTNAYDAVNKSFMEDGIRGNRCLLRILGLYGTSTATLDGHGTGSFSVFSFLDGATTRYGIRPTTGTWCGMFFVFTPSGLSFYEPVFSFSSGTNLSTFYSSRAFHSLTVASTTGTPTAYSYFIGFRTA